MLMQQLRPNDSAEARTVLFAMHRHYHADKYPLNAPEVPDVVGRHRVAQFQSGCSDQQIA